MTSIITVYACTIYSSMNKFTTKKAGWKNGKHKIFFAFCWLLSSSFALNPQLLLKIMRAEGLSMTSTVNHCRIKQM